MTARVFRDIGIHILKALMMMVDNDPSEYLGVILR